MHNEAIQDNVNEKSFKDRLDSANKIIRNRAIASAGVGMIPVPVFDFVALTGIQIDMIRALCKCYEIPFIKDAGKSLVSTLIGSGLPIMASPKLASIIKTIPLIGTTTGAITLSIVGGACTYAVGKVFIQHFEAGGNLLNFNPEKMRAYFHEQYKEGEKVASSS